MIYKLKSYLKWFLRGEIPTEVLVKRGLKVGKNLNRQRKCTIDPPHCWLISMGDNVSLGPGVHILAHDTSTKSLVGYTKIGRVEIGNNTFIGAESLILPNVKIGDDCIIGSKSVVTKDIPSGSVAAGNPATVIMTTKEYYEKNMIKLENSPKYNEEYIIGKITEEMKKEMNEELKGSIGYIK